MNLKDIINLEKNSNPYIQFARYTVVGGLAFLLDFGIYLLGIYVLGIHYLIAAPLGFVVGLTTNYTLSVAWVFADRKYDNRLLELILFTVIGLIGIAITEILLYVLVDQLGADYISSRLVTTAIVYLWNFLARKFGLFNKK